MIKNECFNKVMAVASQVALEMKELSVKDVVINTTKQ